MVESIESPSPRWSWQPIAVRPYEISTADGSRICNGLGIMRQCLETATLERLEHRLGELERGGRATLARGC